MIAHRAFVDYNTYVHLQGGKARTRPGFLLAHLPKNIKSFERTFRRASPYLRPGPVLCLGARTGAESIGATQAGFTGSVGIDLHPAGPTVIKADWHDLPFPANSFANAYSNSLDHCLDLAKLAAEIRRVLVKHGRFYMMATNRRKTEAEWVRQKGSEALYWQTSDELSEAICEHGFTVTASWRDGKWGHYVFGVTR